MRIPYSRKLSRDKTFANQAKNKISRKKLSRFAQCGLRYIEAHVTDKHFADKTFADCHKNAKFAKVFSLESFRLYGSNLPGGF